jgi:hypothetical protein
LDELHADGVLELFVLGWEGGGDEDQCEETGSGHGTDYAEALSLK